MVKSTIFAVIGLSLIAIGAFLAVDSSQGAAGNAFYTYYDRGYPVSPMGERVIPAKCVNPNTMCTAVGECPSGLLMLYRNGYAQGCVRPDFYALPCNRFPAQWNGRICDPRDPNTLGRCVCP